MKISAHFSLWAGVAFALFASAYGLYGLYSVNSGMGAVDLADAHGFAMFWFFLAAIGAVMAGVSWAMLRGRFGRLDD
jgi:hypothetical protein